MTLDERLQIIMAHFVQVLNIAVERARDNNKPCHCGYQLTVGGEKRGFLIRVLSEGFKLELAVS